MLLAKKGSDGFPGYPRNDEYQDPESEWYKKADAWALRNLGKSWGEAFEEAEQWLLNELIDLD